MCMSCECLCTSCLHMLVNCVRMYVHVYMYVRIQYFVCISVFISLPSLLSSLPSPLLPSPPLSSPPIPSLPSPLLPPSLPSLPPSTGGGSSPTTPRRNFEMHWTHCMSQPRHKGACVESGKYVQCYQLTPCTYVHVCACVCTYVHIHSVDSITLISQKNCLI